MSEHLDKVVSALADAIQAYAAEYEGENAIVDSAIVCYEIARYDPETDDVMRRVAYTIPFDNFSLSSALGLTTFVQDMILELQVGGDD